MDLIDTIKQLVMAPGISGYEEPVRNKIKEILKQYGTPREDKIGNLYFSIGEGEEISFISHMDEIGMVVSYIEENGYIRIKKLGGIDNRYLYGRVFEIFPENGTVINAVIGLKPVHLSTEEDLKKVWVIDELLLDVGAKSREEVLKMGIRVLDPVRWKKDFFIMNEQYVVSRGMDNRIGCVALIMAIDKLHKEKLNQKVTFIFSIQEETGLRGARALLREKFSEVYAIDTVSAGDIAKLEYHLSPVHTGEGPAIRFIDSRGISSQRLRKKIKAIAKNESINIQELYALGSTDAAATLELGVESVALCVPVKYTHSPVEAIHLEDLKNTILLIEKIAKS